MNTYFRNNTIPVRFTRLTQRFIDIQTSLVNMVTDMMKHVLVFCILIAMEGATASCIKTTCKPPPCTGPDCSIVEDPTGCTPPRCVCLPPIRCDIACLTPKCSRGTTLYDPPSTCSCARCVCLPKRCATCDPNNTTIPNFPTCQCPTCECIDGKCIDHSATTTT